MISQITPNSSPKENIHFQLLFCLIMQKQRRHHLFGKMTCAVGLYHLEQLASVAFVRKFLAMPQDPTDLHALPLFVSFERYFCSSCTPPCSINYSLKMNGTLLIFSCCNSAGQYILRVEFVYGVYIYGVKQLADTEIESGGENVPEHLVEVSPGVQLWTTISGEQNRTAVMLCGGGPGCADYLEPIAAMMDDAVKVIRFEPRGCGRSTEDYHCDVDKTVADLETIRRYFNLSAWIIAGHSWGANLALAYALKHPERTRGLVYISGNGAQNDRLWSEAYHRSQEQFGEQLPEFPYPSNMEVNRLGNLSWRRFIQTPCLWADLARLSMPALFLYGSEDIRPSWPAEQLANLLPRASWVCVEGAPHYLWLTHHEETRQALCQFVAEQLGISASTHGYFRGSESQD